MDAIATRDPPPAATLAGSLLVAGALSFSAGYLDGFTFVGHHGFATLMTGNFILLGISLVKRSVEDFANLYPILAFMAGVIVADRLIRWSESGPRAISPPLATLVAEVAVLVAVALLPPRLDDHVLVAVVGFTAALQNTCFRSVGTRPYNSIIMTGNLQTFAKGLGSGDWLRERAARAQLRDLGSVLVLFTAGAAAGAFATMRYGDRASLAPAALLAVVALAIVVSDRPRRAAPDR